MRSSSFARIKAGRLNRNATQLTFDLKIDDAYRPFNIKLGQGGVLPSTAPFRLAPPQPAPPEVQVSADGQNSLPTTYMAVWRGADVDQPQNLAKSMTVE